MFIKQKELKMENKHPIWEGHLTTVLLYFRMMCVYMHINTYFNSHRYENMLISIHIHEHLMVTGR